MSRRVLVYRTGLLGDTIIALPALRAIRNHFDGAIVTLLCARFHYSRLTPMDILAHTTLVNGFVEYDARGGLAEYWRLLRRLRAEKYDTVVYLAPTRRTRAASRRDMAFFRLAGIRTFYGFERPTGTARVKLLNKHESSGLLDILSAAGIPPDADASSIEELLVPATVQANCRKWDGPLAAPGAKCIAMGVGSNMPSKQWGFDNFKRLGTELIRRHAARLVLFGGPGDAEMGDRLIAAWGSGVNLAGKVSVLESYHLLKKCSLYVGNDTGTMHLAALAGAVCVGIYSARDIPGKWDPRGREHIVLRAAPDCAGCMLAVCVDRDNDCLRQITLESVLAAVERSGAFLGRARTGGD